MLALGGYLKKKENLSARLGDVLSCMYLASMVLKHHENQGSPEDELPIVEWGCRAPAVSRAGTAARVSAQLPQPLSRGLHALLHLPARPDLLRAERPARSQHLGPHHESDRGAGSACAAASTRRWSRPTRSACCRKRSTLSLTAEPIEKRIRVEGQKTGKVTALDLPGQITQSLALGLITETEAAMLREYDRKVMDLINVDDFAPHELGVSTQPAPVGAETAGQRSGRLTAWANQTPQVRLPNCLHRAACL